MFLDESQSSKGCWSVQSSLKFFKEPSFSSENAFLMDLRHSCSSDRSSLLEEILLATHFCAILSLGPHVWRLFWIVWLRGFTSSLLRLTLDPPCHARNINKLCFHSSNCFIFHSHLWKASYCCNLVLILNKKQFHPFPLMAIVLKLRDLCRMEILAWCLSFHKTTINFGRAEESAGKHWSCSLKIGLAEHSKGLRCTKVLLSVGIGIPKSEWQSCVPGPDPSAHPAALSGPVW